MVGVLASGADDPASVLRVGVVYTRLAMMFKVGSCRHHDLCCCNGYRVTLKVSRLRTGSSRVGLQAHRLQRGVLKQEWGDWGGSATVRKDGRFYEFAHRGTGFAEAYEGVLG